MATEPFRIRQARSKTSRISGENDWNPSEPPVRGAMMFGPAISSFFTNLSSPLAGCPPVRRNRKRTARRRSPYEETCHDAKRESRHISQEVCPFNSPKFVQITSEEAFRPRQGVHGAELIELMGMDQAEFSRRFKGSPVKRAKRRGLLRNVAVALGNWGSPEAVPVLATALEDAEPLIRGHAARALGRIGTAEARQALASRVGVEKDEWTREEIALVLASHADMFPNFPSTLSSGISPGECR
jgi:hypothetical protein